VYWFFYVFMGMGALAMISNWLADELGYKRKYKNLPEDLRPSKGWYKEFGRYQK
jgi:hypothetical protein